MSEAGKRSFIVDRAKKLLEGIQGSETREMADDLKTQSRLAKLQDYGEEKLPAGDISEHEIIVVEGRADVVNMLKNNVNNVIGMNGTKLPEEIKKLSYDKEVTLFVDGDRGGKLIAKNVCDNARVDFIAVAPDGKEVEELQGKEILSALRRKVPAAEFFKSEERQNGFRRNFETRERSDRYERNDRYPRRDFRERREEPAAKEDISIEIGEGEKEKLREIMKDIEGTKNAVLLDSKLEKIKEVSSKSINSSLARHRDARVIVFDGTVTGGMIYVAEKEGIKAIAAKNFAATETSIKLISL